MNVLTALVTSFNNFFLYFDFSFTIKRSVFLAALFVHVPYIAIFYRFYQSKFITGIRLLNLPRG